MMLIVVFMLLLVVVVLVECIPVESCFPSSGVASLRPRLGGEPPWFTIVISLMQVLIDSLGTLSSCCLLMFTKKKRMLLCLS